MCQITQMMMDDISDEQTIICNAPLILAPHLRRFRIATRFEPVTFLRWQAIGMVAAQSIDLRKRLHCWGLKVISTVLSKYAMILDIQRSSNAEVKQIMVRNKNFATT